MTSVLRQRRDSWSLFLRERLAPCLGLDSVHVDAAPTHVDAVTQQRRPVTALECADAHLTLSCAVRASASGPALFELPVPVPDDPDYFVVSGQPRVLMLRRARLPVPVTSSGGRVSWPCESPWESVSPCGWFDADDVARTWRVLLPHELMCRLVRGCWRASRGRYEGMTSGLRRAFATGQWPGGAVGVTQLRPPTTSWPALRSQLLSCSSTLDPQHAGAACRQLRPSSIGVLCPYETSEGASCGLTATLASCCRLGWGWHGPDPGWPPGEDVVAHAGVLRRGVDARRCAALRPGSVLERVAGVHFLFTESGLFMRACGSAWAGAAPLPCPGASVLGPSALSIPFGASHNQAARVTYACAQLKQAAAPPSSPSLPWLRNAACRHELAYPQRPLVRTSAASAPSGQSCVVLVQELGENPEDSIIVSAGSLERGLFAVLEHRCYSSASPAGGVPAGGGVPAPGPCDSDGLPSVGERLRPGDWALSGSVRVPPRVPPATVCEASLSACGRRTVRTSAYVALAGGDKLTTRHAQKGTVVVWPERDMPFDAATGQPADLVISASSFPTRLTVGMHLEIALGAECARDGRPGAVHPVFSAPPDFLERVVLRSPSVSRGSGAVVSGRTGEPVRGPLFWGLCQYYTLPAHRAQGKCYGRRARGGPVDPVTLAPTKGRSRGGGLRLGEMEREVLAGSGAGAALAHVHASSGGDASCDRLHDLLRHELLAMGVDMRLCAGAAP